MWKKVKTQPVAYFSFLNGGKGDSKNAFDHELYKDTGSGRVLVARMDYNGSGGYCYRYLLFKGMDDFIQHVIECKPVERTFYACLEPHLPVGLFCDQELERDRHALGSTEASKQNRLGYQQALCRLMHVDPNNHAKPDAKDEELSAAYNQYQFDAHSSALCWSIRLCLELVYQRCLLTHWYVLCADRPGKKYSRHVHAPELWFPQGVHQLYELMKVLIPMQTLLLGNEDLMLAQDIRVNTKNRLMRMAGQRKEPTIDNKPLVAHHKEMSEDLSPEQWLRVSMVTQPKTDRLAPLQPLDSLFAAEQLLNRSVWEPMLQPSAEPVLSAPVLELAMSIAECKPRWLSTEIFSVVCTHFDKPENLKNPLHRQRALQYCFMVVRYYSPLDKAPPSICQRLATLNKLCVPLEQSRDSPLQLCMWREFTMLAKCMFNFRYSSMLFREQEDQRWSRRGMSCQQMFALVMGPLRWALFSAGHYRSYDALDQCEFTMKQQWSTTDQEQQEDLLLNAVQLSLSESVEQSFLQSYDQLFDSVRCRDLGAQSLCSFTMPSGAQ